MVEKIGISMSEYAYDRIMKAKPPRKNRSEWIEELALRQLDMLNAEANKKKSMGPAGFEPAGIGTWLKTAAIASGGIW